MSWPTSVPGLGRLGRALFRTSCPVVPAPIASPGLAAPSNNESLHFVLKILK